MMWMRSVDIVVWINATFTSTALPREKEIGSSSHSSTLCCMVLKNENIIYIFVIKISIIWFYLKIITLQLVYLYPSHFSLKCKNLVISRLEETTESCLENETFLKSKVYSVIFFNEFGHSLLSLFGTVKNNKSWNNSKEQLKFGDCLAVYRNSEDHLQSTNFQNLSWFSFFIQKAKLKKVKGKVQYTYVHFPEYKEIF